MASLKNHITNGCWYTEPNVSPLNWKTKDASMDKPWFIFYTYFDPSYAQEYPTGKKVQIKGFAQFKNLKERQAAVKLYLEDNRTELEDNLWNPISKKYMNAFCQEVNKNMRLMRHSKITFQRKDSIISLPMWVIDYRSRDRINHQIYT